MAAASITSIANGIEAQLDAMVKNANLVPGYLDRVVYKQYQKAQRERWETENESQGDTWKPLDPAYALYKRKKFAQYKGGGTKLLVATGRLFEGVIGPGHEHGKIVEERAITISTTVPYATYVNENRTFTKFSPQFYSDVYGGLKDYLIKSLVKNV